jgi:RNA polymerase sigma factor (sigma-70 family)
MTSLSPDEVATTPEAIQVLVDNHRRFLAFLERRVGSREDAEDILQEAFVRGLDKVQDVRDQESVIAWFYRLLRNAVVDYYRRRGAEGRALEWIAARSDEVVEPLDESLFDDVCACLGSLMDTLKPEYAEVLRSVELEGLAVREYADRVGITPNNAGVRVHRAREALRRQVVRACGSCAEHGCLACSCQAVEDCNGGKD